MSTNGETDDYKLTQNGLRDDSLFDAALLESLPWNERKATYRGNIDLIRPAPGLLLRPLALQDYDLGFLSVLSQLTTVGEVTRQQFEERFHAMKSCHGTYYILVVEDQNKAQLVGSATLVVEQKFIHQTATRGRIEDVVVAEECRGQQLGKLLVDALTLLARSLGCYKLSLECNDKNVKFYESLGFRFEEENFMVQRFRK